MTIGIMRSLDIVICKDADEAIEKGFSYRDADIKPIDIERVVVVQRGMESGKSTVDFVLKDADGNRFVVMVTGALIAAIPI